MFLTSPITNVSTGGWPAYAGKKPFATNADQGKEMAQVCRARGPRILFVSEQKKEL